VLGDPVLQRAQLVALGELARERALNWAWPPGA
jgi:hypothetical protein